MTKHVILSLKNGTPEIVIDTTYCKTLSYQEKAALGYISTYLQSNCNWDGDRNADGTNLKCELLTALNLGCQCSEEHLGFLKKWFKNDSEVLNSLGNCETIANYQSIQNKFDEILISSDTKQIIVYVKAHGLDMRDKHNTAWDWKETNYFNYTNTDIQKTKTEKSKVIHRAFNEQKD